MTAMTLFELAAERRALAERLMDLDLDDQTIADTLDGESGALESKATDVVSIARALDTFAAAIRVEEERLAARRKAAEARAARLHVFVRDAMLLAGIEKIEGPRFKLSLRTGAQRVVVDSAEQVPQGYLRFAAPPPPEPDKAAIGAALKAGIDVPGCRLERGAPTLLVR